MLFIFNALALTKHYLPRFEATEDAACNLQGSSQTIQARRT